MQHLTQSQINALKLQGYTVRKKRKPRKTTKPVNKAHPLRWAVSWFLIGYISCQTSIFSAVFESLKVAAKAGGA